MSRSAEFESPAASTRKFNLSDSMILTVAAALALIPPSGEYLLHCVAKTRAWYEWVAHIMSWRVIPGMVGVDLGRILAKDVLNYVGGLITNPLIGLTLAVVLLRLRRPRPCWSTIWRQPGFVACVAAPLGMLVFLEMIHLGGEFRVQALGGDVRPSFVVAGSILAAWMTLAVLLRWQAEPSWIDRLGRAAGLGWLLLAISELVERKI